MNFEDFKLKYQKKEVLEELNDAPKTPLVSVLVQTYQHVDYIKMCLDSILMQKTNFEFEIILGEDASVDGTREICINYAKQQPNKIRLFLHHRENNIQIGGAPTGRFILISNLMSARGNYIALCEGDDYWTDPLKLQKQVDFLESNPECKFVCTNYSAPYLTSKNFSSEIKEIRPFEMLYSSPVGTLTVLFEKELIKEFQANSSLSMGDYPLWIYLLKKTKLYKLPDITATYNVLENSATGRNDIKKQIKFAIDVIKVTKDHISDFDLSESQKASVLRERYGYLFVLLNDKIGFLKHFKEYFFSLGIQNFKLIDLKIFFKKLIT